ncbi:MAG: hypothetical protein ACREJM_05065, partial [Candidatus Saccharimonadales bacterium]
MWIARESVTKIGIGIGLVYCPDCVEHPPYLSLDSASPFSQIGIAVVEIVPVDFPKACHCLLNT